MNAANSPSQTSITDFFDTVAEVIQHDEETSNQIINTCGNEQDSTASVLLVSEYAKKCLKYIATCKQI